MKFDINAFVDSAIRAHPIAPALEQLAPLQWVDMTRWDEEPIPERKWAIPNRVPLNQAGLFSGEGGTGKKHHRA
jgi:hypothetical protein